MNIEVSGTQAFSEGMFFPYTQFCLINVMQKVKLSAMNFLNTTILQVKCEHSYPVKQIYLASTAVRVWGNFLRCNLSTTSQ